MEETGSDEGAASSQTTCDAEMVDVCAALRNGTILQDGARTTRAAPRRPRHTARRAQSVRAARSVEFAGNAGSPEHEKGKSILVRRRGLRRCGLNHRYFAGVVEAGR